MTVAGFTKVPEILSSPTGMSICSSRVAMKPRSRIFGKGADFGVVSLEIHRGVRRRFVARPINFEAFGADRLHIRVRLKNLQSSHFGTAGAAEAPGLLQHAGTAPAIGGYA